MGMGGGGGVDGDGRGWGGGGGGGVIRPVPQIICTPPPPLVRQLSYMMAT